MTYSLWQIQLSLVCYMHTTSSSTVRPVKIERNLMTRFNFTLKTNANSTKMFLISPLQCIHMEMFYLENKVIPAHLETVAAI